MPGWTRHPGMHGLRVKPAMTKNVLNTMTETHKPRFQAVASTRHATRRWRPAGSYSWAAAEVLVPVTGSEVSRAAAHMPIALIRGGDAFTLAAVLGLERGVSLFVAPDGRWLGGYVPALLRSRPFALLPLEDGRKVLCIDEEAGRVALAADAPDAQPFFGEDGKLSPALQEFLGFLSALEGNREPTAKACIALETHKVVVPWQIKLQMEAGTTRDVEGLYRVDEAALLALPDEAFLELRRTGALALAYAQLLSIAQLPALGQRASARLAALQQPMAPVTPTGDLDLSFLERGGTLRFS
jgi:SapC protein